jgi:hypothetical protein
MIFLKRPDNGTREEKRKYQRVNKRSHLKMQNTQWGALRRGENTKLRT